MPLALGLAAGASLAQGISSYVASDRAADKTLKIGQKNLRRMAMERRERLRRFDSAREEIMGQAMATQAASGFDVSDVTSTSALGSMEEEFQTQRDFMRISDEMAMDIASQEIEAQAQSIRSQGQTALLSGGLSALSTIGNANDWWQS